MTLETSPEIAAAERLVAAIQELSLAKDLPSVMGIVRRAARELSGADGASFVLKEGDLCHYADEEAIGPLWKGQRFPQRACISGWTMLHRQPAVIENIFEDPRIPIAAYQPTFVRSLAMVPVRTEDPIAAIGCYWSTHRRATDWELRLIQALADSTSVAMQNLALGAELTAAAQSARAGEARLGLALEAARSGTFDWDIAGERVAWSPELERLYGLPVGSFGGSYRHWAEHVVPEDVSGIERSIQDCFAARQEDFTYEFRLLLPEGGRRWIEGRARFRYDAAGRPLSMVGINTDIDERKRAQLNTQFLSALNQEIALLSDPDEMIAASLRAVGTHLGGHRAYILTPTGTGDGVLVSDTWRRDETATNLRGAYDLKSFMSEAARSHFFRLPVAIDNVQVSDLTQAAREAHAALRIGAWVTAPYVREGRCEALLAVTEDRPRHWRPDETALLESVISRVWPLVERARNEQAMARAQAQVRESEDRLRAALSEKRAELEQLVAERTRKLQEMISDLEGFSYSISHDLRAPLRAMQSFARILEEDCGSQLSGNAPHYLQRIIASAERMDRLIHDVLLYSRVARSDAQLKPLDLQSVLAVVIETYPQLQSPAAVIEVVAPLGKVMANDAALMQCLSNLLGNAVKFMAPGVQPNIRVWTTVHERRVRVYVQDNGIGIAPEYHQKIFGIFERLSHDYDGTGIGLAVTRKAAERMGGTVTVESRVGAGSTFCLELARPA